MADLIMNSRRSTPTSSSASAGMSPNPAATWHGSPYGTDVFTYEHATAVYMLAQCPSRLGRQVSSALSVLQQALDRYGAEHLAISFNGGKDCTVLVHLLLALLYRSAGSQTSPAPVPALYVRCPSPFPQLEEFIHYATDFYHLNLHTITKDMRSALADFKSQQSQCRAIIIGTRRTDPHGNKLHDFDNTDVHKGWPDLMRVHPVLDWSYADVWAFLRCTDLYNNTGLPYCVLYDYGYTSLGSTHDTFPNPALRNEDEVALWNPAWMLQDESKERSGRELLPSSSLTNSQVNGSNMKDTTSAR